MVYIYQYVTEAICQYMSTSVLLPESVLSVHGYQHTCTRSCWCMLISTLKWEAVGKCVPVYL